MQNTNIMLKAVLFLAVMILFSSLAVESRAANFVVNSTLDRQDRVNGDGSCETITERQCTLRAAITEANATPGDDIISLPAGIYQITLASAGEDSNAGGDFDVNSSITFNGAGAGSTFVQAASSAGTATERVIHFLSGTSIIKGVTIRYGGGLAGAGVWVNSSANITLNSVTVSDNISLGSGGGIFSSGALTINNSLITNNSTGSNPEVNNLIGGAGILSQGNTTLNNTTVSFNKINTTASGSLQIHGGGIWGFNGTLNINSSSINGNEVIMTSSQITNAFGGGVSVAGAVVTINDSSVTNNIVSANNFRSGGGISVTFRMLTLNRTLVRGNNPGGIDMTYYHSGFSGNYDFYINQSAVTNNIGDGIRIGEGLVYAEVNNTTIAQNSGGGIINFFPNSINTLNVNFSTIARNSVGVSGRANLKNSIVADNAGASGTNPDIAGTEITSKGYNHVENVGSAAFTPTTGDVTGSDPMLGELTGSGSNSVFIPALNSPVIETILSGTNGCGTAPFDVDQRNAARPTDSNGDAAAACEKGAVEIPALSSCPVITLTPSNLSNGTTASSYNQIISATGGAGEYYFAVSNGSLPEGLALNPSTGEITGIPTTSGTFNFTVSATDSNGCTGSKTFSTKISSLDTDGDGVEDAHDNCPATPNPEKITFSSRRDGNQEIYVMNADGSNPVRLTNNSLADLEPSFSPDGNRIVFGSTRDNNDEIYVMNADGSNQTRLTYTSTAGDNQPSFSPDGSKIVFISSRVDSVEIFVMNTDGSDQTRLTSNTTIDRDPSFSPDGSKIVFTSYRNPGIAEIYVMNSDGSNQTRLTYDNGFNSEPAFSPDGSKIVFTSFRDGRFAVYAMNADGSNQTLLTNSAAGDYNPSFSPDGSKIIFTSLRDGNEELYVMNADGSDPVRLTYSTELDREASWGGQPDADGDGIGDACDNTAPTINASSVNIAQNAASTSQPIATVSDNEAIAENLTVTVAGAPTGVIIENISIDSNGVVTATVAAACSAPIGVNIVKLQVSDGELSSTADLTVNVTPSNPAVIKLKPFAVLSPPNHKLQTFSVSQMVQSATDDCGGNVIGSVTIEKVTSDEAADAPGSGNTENDAIIDADCRSIQLRAERSGTGNGRVYSITLKVIDSSGNTTRTNYKVFVPKGNQTAIEDAPAYTVNGNCP